MPETEVYADILSTIFRHGCHAHYPTLILHTGPESLAWGPPRWTTTAERAHRFAEGDLVLAEIFPTFGNTEAFIGLIPTSPSSPTRPWDARVS